MIQLLLLFKRRLGKGRRDFTCVIFSLGARVASRRTCCCGSSRVCKQIKIWVSLILLLLRPSAINQTFVTVSARWNRCVGCPSPVSVFGHRQALPLVELAH